MMPLLLRRSGLAGGRASCELHFSVVPALLLLLLLPPLSGWVLPTRLDMVGARAGMATEPRQGSFPTDPKPSDRLLLLMARDDADTERIWR